MRIGIVGQNVALSVPIFKKENYFIPAHLFFFFPISLLLPFLVCFRFSKVRLMLNEF